MDKKFNDSFIYNIWLYLNRGDITNDEVFRYLHNSHIELKRDEFFIFLWESLEFDNILNSIRYLSRGEYNEMKQWINNYLLKILF